jgi:hypothetical protein
MKRAGVAACLAAGLLLLADQSVSPAYAATWDWTLSGVNISGSGTLTTDSYACAGGCVVQSITGTFLGLSITGLDPTFPYPSSGFGNPDNTIYSPTDQAFPTKLLGYNLDSFGLSFDFTNQAPYGNGAVNIICCNFAGEIITDKYFNSLYSLPSGTVVFTLVPEVSATPLPAALPLFATGLGGLGLLGWRSERWRQKAPLSDRRAEDFAMRRIAAAALASALFFVSPAYAVTIYSNFGSGTPGYNTAGGALIISPLAWAFTAAETANVTQIDIPFFAFTTSNSFTVSLYDANGGNLGALLGSWTLQNVTTDRTNDLHTISGITGVTLDAGVSYFLSVTFGGSGSGGDWNANTIGALATWIQGTLHATNGVQGSIRRTRQPHSAPPPLSLSSPPASAA